MKITKENLKRIIQEELDAALANEGKHKGEGTMARSQLARTGEIAHMLEKMIGDDTNLP